MRITKTKFRRAIIEAYELGLNEAWMGSINKLIKEYGGGEYEKRKQTILSI